MVTNWSIGISLFLGNMIICRALALDPAGKVIIQIVKGHYDGNSPRVFAKNLEEEMKKANL
jgi:hypothetical protein